MKRRFEMRLLNGVGAALGLSILLVTVAQGWTVYQDLYRVILDGFDRKLKAISTATGSFISGDEHRKLERANRIRGLAYDPQAKLLYRIDPASRSLLGIDPVDGSAAEIGPVGLAEVRGLAYDSSRQLLAALATSEGQTRLSTVDPATGRVERVGDVGFPDCTGLAYEESTASFYCLSPAEPATTQLVRIDPETGTGAAETTLDGDHRWVAAGPGGGIVTFSLVGAGDEVDGELQQISLSGGEPQRRSALSRVDWMNGVFGLAWDPEQDRGWLLTDRLLGVGMGEEQSSKPIPYQSQDGAVYRRYGEAMRGIKNRASITYLYTQIAHPDPTKCIYILNANCDPDLKDHTPLGDEDDLPEESYLGQRDVLSRAEIYLSSVETWEKWGLLKGAFAPIFDDGGEVSAIAGADVNISIIRDKTRDALLKVFGIGALFICVGLLVSILAARKIVGPITEVKEAALRFGAGQYDKRIGGGRLRELEQLSEAFNRLGETLKSSVNRMEEANDEIETLRRMREMEEHLAGRLAAALPEAGDTLAWRLLEDPGSTTASGILSAGRQGTIAWLAPFRGPRVEAIKLRHEIGTVVGHELGGAGPAELWTRLERLYPHSVEAYLWLARDNSEFRWLARRPVSIRLLGDGRTETRKLVDSGHGTLDPGGVLFLGADRPAIETVLEEVAVELERPDADAGALLVRLTGEPGEPRWGLSLVARRPKPEVTADA